MSKEIKTPKPIVKNNKIVNKGYCSCGLLRELNFPRTAIRCNCSKNLKKKQPIEKN